MASNGRKKIGNEKTKKGPPMSSTTHTFSVLFIYSYEKTQAKQLNWHGNMEIMTKQNRFQKYRIGCGNR